MGWAALALFVGLARRRDLWGLAAAQNDDVRHSVGKLLFAFCFLAMDFFWSQFLVIWYGNLAEETPFILRRIREQPWQNVALLVLLFAYVVPFFALLFKSIWVKSLGSRALMTFTMAAAASGGVGAVLISSSSLRMNRAARSR